MKRKLVGYRIVEVKEGFRSAGCATAAFLREGVEGAKDAGEAAE